MRHGHSCALFCHVLRLLALLGVSAAGQLTAAGIDERIRELRESLPSDQELASEEDLRGIAQLVERMFGSEGICVPDHYLVRWLTDLRPSAAHCQALAECCDVDHMFDVLETGNFERDGQSPGEFRRLHHDKFFRQIGALPFFHGTKSCSLRRLHLHSDRGQAELFVRQTFATGESGLVHYWLGKRDGRWLIREFEQTDFGRRHVAGFLAELAPREDLKDYRAAVRETNDARPSVFGIPNWYFTAVHAFREGVELDADNEAYYWLLKGLHHSSSHDYAQALEALAVADKQRDDFPLALRVRIKCSLEEERYVQAVAEIRRYEDWAGADDKVLGDLATALVALGRRDDAIDAYRRALVENPDSLDSLQALMNFEPCVSPRELEEHLRRMPMLRNDFDELARAVLAWGESALYQRLVEWHREMSPTNDLSDFYAAESLHYQDRYEQAAPLFHAAMKRFPKRCDIQKSYLDCMHELDRDVEGYLEATQPEVAFAHLAEELNRRNSAAFLKLVAAHRQRCPHDRQLRIYEARAKAQQDQYAEAVAIMRELLKEAPDEDQKRWRRLYQSWVSRAGQHLEAYQADSWKDDLFPTLAQDLLSDQSFDTLQRLIAMHEQRHPNDKSLLVWKAKILFRQDQPQAAADLLRPHLCEIADIELQRSFLYFMCRCGKATEAYLESPLRSDAFDYLVDKVDDADELERLLVAVRVHEPDRSDLPYYHARLLIKRDRDIEAMLYLRGILRNAPPEEQLSQLRGMYFELALKHYAPLTVYDEADDAPYAFRQLASTFDQNDDYDRLAVLLEKHRRRVPSDRAIRYQYSGRIHAHFQRWDQAIHDLSESQKLERTERTEDLLLLAYCRAGKAVEAYEKLKYRAENFESLSKQCLHLSDGDQLAALVAARKRDIANPHSLLDTEVTSLWLKKDYEGLVKRMQPWPAPRRLQFPCESYYMRSLIHLRRYDEAARVAADLDRSVPFYTALVAASRGDVPAATAAIEKCVAKGTRLRRFDDDEMFSPLLKVPPFDAFWLKQKAIEDAN